MEKTFMKKLTVSATLLIVTAISSNVFAGGVKEAHPCYDVADCKSEASQKEFSACIKANLEEANANEQCKAFRDDKPAYLEKSGLSDLKGLFN
jgi:hypothetical protein